MTLTVTAVPGSTDWPSVQLSVASSPSVSGLLKVFRTHEDGSRHQVLTDSSATLVGTWVGSDLHAPFNQWVTYTAEAAGQVSAASAEVVVPSTVVWLVHPTDPALSVMTDWITKVDDYSFAPVVVRSKVLNSKLPRFSASSPREGEKGSLTVLLDAEDKRRAMRALLADGGQILLNTPYSDVELGWKWIQPGEYTEQNPTERRRNDVRTGTFSYEECQQPDVDVRIRTLDELRADFPAGTLNSLNTAYASLNDLKLDIRQP